jgi:hypothetical protein
MENPSELPTNANLTLGTNFRGVSFILRKSRCVDPNWPNMFAIMLLLNWSYSIAEYIIGTIVFCGIELDNSYFKTPTFEWYVV